MKWRKHHIDPDAQFALDVARIVLKLCAVVIGGILVCVLIIAGDAWLVRIALRGILPG